MNFVDFYLPLYMLASPFPLPGIIFLGLLCILYITSWFYSAAVVIFERLLHLLEEVRLKGLSLSRALLTMLRRGKIMSNLRYKGLLGLLNIVIIRRLFFHHVLIIFQKFSWTTCWGASFPQWWILREDGDTFIIFLWRLKVTDMRLW